MKLALRMDANCVKHFQTFPYFVLIKRHKTQVHYCLNWTWPCNTTETTRRCIRYR